MTARASGCSRLGLGLQHFVELVEVFRPLLLAPLVMVVGLLLLLTVLVRPLLHRPDATLRTAAEVSRQGPAGQVRMMGMGMGMVVVEVVVVKGRGGGVVLLPVVMAVMVVMAVVIVLSCGGRHHLLMPKHVKIHGLAPPHDGVSGHLLLPALVRSAGAVGGVKRGAFLLGRF